MAKIPVYTFRCRLTGWKLSLRAQRLGLFVRALPPHRQGAFRRAYRQIGLISPLANIRKGAKQETRRSRFESPIVVGRFRQLKAVELLGG